jgi:hypothetical protein
MDPKRLFKVTLNHFGIGVLLPVALLINAFVIPEPYSHPLINVAIAPTKIMPFLEDRELMRELTISVFGRMTPNYAPITIVFLMGFWFIIGLLLSLAYSAYQGEKKNA